MKVIETITARRGRWLRAALLSVTSLAPVVGGTAGCTQQTVVLPSRDFEKPTDMAFACLGIFADDGTGVRVVGQPMGNCHPSGILDGPAHPGALEVTATTPKFRTYAFVPNAARGDLSVVDMSYCRPDDTKCLPPGAKIVDLDPDSIGFAAAPLGVLPEVIAASQDGCRIATANRGSCDLTFVNPAVLLAPSLGSMVSVPELTVEQRSAARDALNGYARTVVPRTSSGRLAVAPAEIAFVPQQTLGLDGRPDPLTASGNPNLCTAEGTLAAPVGAPPATAAALATWRAVVTFPSCDLVALIDLPSGDILDSYQVDATDSGFTFVRSGRDPVCPIKDCGLGAGTVGGGVPVDAGGGAPTDATGADATAGNEAGTGAGGAGGSTAADAAVDTTASDDAAASTAALVNGTSGSSLRVGALALHPEGKRVYFGASNSPFVGALDITGAADALAEPATGGSTRLEAGAGGVTRMRLSVDPFAFSKGHDVREATRPEYGRFVAGRHDDQPGDPLEFLYVIARDGTVRVVDVAAAAPFECDLWIDPADPRAGAVDPSDAVRTGCFPYPVAGVDGPGRFQYAGPPGLRFSSPPQDITFANYRTRPLENSTAANITLNEQTLSGAFAFVLTVSGAVQIVNIDPDLRALQKVVRADDGTVTSGPVFESPKPLTHSVRDSNVVTFSASLGPQNGPPRIDVAPTGPVDGPNLRPFDAFETRINARVVPPAGGRPVQRELTYAYFPNRTNVLAQAWSISWEGDLTGARPTGDIAEPNEPPPLGGVINGPVDPPLATTITDNGSGFCGSAIDGDVMTLLGCDTDNACPPGSVCVRSVTAPPSVHGHPINGMCFRRDRVNEFRTTERCSRMLDTPRRYEIVSSPTDSVSVVIPKRAELHRPSFLDNGELVNCSPRRTPPGGTELPDTCAPTSGMAITNFQCVPVNVRLDGTPTGAPLGPTDPRRRCLIPCDGNEGICGRGMVCLDFPPTGKFCAEAAPLAKGCGFEQLFSYKLSAAGAFIVSGSAAGRSEGVTKKVGPNGPVCVVDPARSPARIPLNSPACGASIVDGYAAAKMAAIGGTDPEALGAPARWLAGTRPLANPCLITEDMGTGKVVSALFENAELRFLLTDMQKITDVTQIRFEVHGGVNPQVVSPSVDAQPGLAARIVVGPIPQPDQKTLGDPIPALCAGPAPCADNVGLYSDLPYLFVVDQRQFISGRVGYRGQILRLTPRIADAVPLAGFESFSAGGRYFPIQ